MVFVIVLATTQPMKRVGFQSNILSFDLFCQLMCYITVGAGNSFFDQIKKTQTHIRTSTKINITSKMLLKTEIHPTLQSKIHFQSKRTESQLHLP